MSISSPTNHTSSADRAWALYAKVAWRLLPILFLVQVVGFLDRVNIGFAKLQMQTDLGLSNAAYGLGAGIFFIGYFIFELPSTLMLKRIGAKTFFARILITWGAATIALAFVKNETWFYILRFVVGMAEAGFAPATQLYFSQWFPTRFRGRINGLFLMSIPLSVVIGGPLAGFVMGNMTGLGLSGWQWLFIVEGIVSVALTPFLLSRLSNTVEEASWLTGQEKGVIRQDLAAGESQANSSTWQSMLRMPKTLWLTVVYFLMQCGNYGVAFWLPQIIKNTGVQSAMTVGWLSAIPYLVSIGRTGG